MVRNAISPLPGAVVDDGHRMNHDKRVASADLSCNVYVKMHKRKEAPWGDISEHSSDVSIKISLSFDGDYASVTSTAGSPKTWRNSRSSTREVKV